MGLNDLRVSDMQPSEVAACSVTGPVQSMPFNHQQIGFEGVTMTIDRRDS
jgi:hypothetical protein